MSLPRESWDVLGDLGPYDTRSSALEDIEYFRADPNCLLLAVIDKQREAAGLDCFAGVYGLVDLNDDKVSTGTDPRCMILITGRSLARVVRTHQHTSQVPPHARQLPRNAPHPLVPVRRGAHAQSAIRRINLAQSLAGRRSEVWLQARRDLQESGRGCARA